MAGIVVALALPNECGLTPGLFGCYRLHRVGLRVVIGFTAGVVASLLILIGWRARQGPRRLTCAFDFEPTCALSRSTSTRFLTGLRAREEVVPMEEMRPEQAAPRDQVGRAVGIVGLLAIALIHYLDAFSTFPETPYIGALYIVLMVVVLLVSGVLLRTDSRLAWMLAAAAAGLTALGYVLSRATGLPGATDDIGNWTDPLGLASLWVEGLVFLLGTYKVVTTPRIRPLSRAVGRLAKSAA